MTIVYEHTRKVGIKASPEFQKKQLATHGANVGMLCGHGCLYCSTPAVLGRNPAYKATTGMTAAGAFDVGVAIVDPETPKRFARDAVKLKPEHTVMLATMTDAFSPEAQEHDLGRRCAEIIIKESKAKLRVLTKNEAVVKDFDLYAQYPGRVMVGMSVTALPTKQHVIDVLEPNASPIAERLVAYEKAKDMGIRTFAMLCPLLPGLATSYVDIHELMEIMLAFGVENIWVEPVNKRGGSLLKCQRALEEAGMNDLAYNIEEIRSTEMHQLYTDELIDVATNAARDLGCLDKLKILVYGDPNDHYFDDDAVVIWL